MQNIPIPNGSWDPTAGYSSAAGFNAYTDSGPPDSQRTSEYTNHIGTGDIGRYQLPIEEHSRYSIINHENRQITQQWRYTIGELAQRRAEAEAEAAALRAQVIRMANERDQALEFGEAWRNEAERSSQETQRLYCEHNTLINPLSTDAVYGDRTTRAQYTPYWNNGYMGQVLASPIPLQCRLGPIVSNTTQETPQRPEFGNEFRLMRVEATSPLITRLSPTTITTPTTDMTTTTGNNTDVESGSNAHTNTYTRGTTPEEVRMRREESPSTRRPSNSNRDEKMREAKRLRQKAKRVRIRAENRALMEGHSGNGGLTSNDAEPTSSHTAPQDTTTIAPSPPTQLPSHPIPTAPFSHRRNAAMGLPPPLGLNTTRSSRKPPTHQRQISSGSTSTIDVVHTTRPMSCDISSLSIRSSLDTMSDLGEALMADTSHSAVETTAPISHQLKSPTPTGFGIEEWMDHLSEQDMDTTKIYPGLSRNPNTGYAKDVVEGFLLVLPFTSVQNRFEDMERFASYMMEKTGDSFILQTNRVPKEKRGPAANNLSDGQLADYITSVAFADEEIERIWRWIDIVYFHEMISESESVFGEDP